jgi:hypothetical protein
VATVVERAINVNRNRPVIGRRSEDAVGREEGKERDDKGSVVAVVVVVVVVASTLFPTQKKPGPSGLSGSPGRFVNLVNDLVVLLLFIQQRIRDTSFRGHGGDMTHHIQVPLPEPDLRDLRGKTLQFLRGGRTTRPNAGTVNNLYELIRDFAPQAGMLLLPRLFTHTAVLKMARFNGTLPSTIAMWSGSGQRCGCCRIPQRICCDKATSSYISPVRMNRA